MERAQLEAATWTSYSIGRILGNDPETAVRFLEYALADAKSWRLSQMRFQEIQEASPPALES